MKNEGGEKKEVCVCFSMCTALSPLRLTLPPLLHNLSPLYLRSSFAWGLCCLLLLQRHVFPGRFWVRLHIIITSSSGSLCLSELRSCLSKTVVMMLLPLSPSLCLVFLFKAWLGFPTAESVWFPKRLFQDCLSAGKAALLSPLYPSAILFQLYMLLNHAWGGKRECTRGENGRGKSPRGVADFLLSVSSFPPLCLSVFSLQPAVSLIGYPSAVCHWLTSYFPGKWEWVPRRLSVRPLSCSGSFPGLIPSDSVAVVCVCVREKERQEERDRAR